ncbi:MAG: FAD-dependent monooxygenase [Eubacteriales bacterium]
MYNVIIVGAGPSGLTAGMILKREGISFLIIEKGKKYDERSKQIPDDVSFGVGGAGLFSDGKLSYAPAGSKMWGKLNEYRLKQAYEEVWKLLHVAGIDLKFWDDLWIKYCNENHDMYKNYDSCYLDEDVRKKICEYFVDLLAENLKEEEVDEINKIKDGYVVKCKGGAQYEAEHIIIATGKMSAKYLLDKIDGIEWNAKYEMGVRIEMSNENFSIDIGRQSHDYKLIDSIDSMNQVRTFCYCRNGSVIKSSYGNNSTYNGETEKKSNDYTNIGVILRTEDHNSNFAKEIIDTYYKNQEVEMSLKEYLEGALVVGLEVDKRLKKMICQIIKSDNEGKLYGPEIEKFGDYPQINKNLECIEDLYVIGDATSMFRGLMTAFVSGAYMARVLVEKRKNKFDKSLSKLNIKKSNTDEMKLIFTAQSKAYFYCRDVVCQYVLNREMLPINPFRVFDYFLGDRVKRDLVRRGNNQLIKTCQELWVFGTIADGVLFEIASAIEQNKPIRFFTIGTKVEEIKEISVHEITFEPEVHSRKIKKTDLIEFISNQNSMKKEDYVQLSFEDFLD